MYSTVHPRDAGQHPKTQIQSSTAKRKEIKSIATEMFVLKSLKKKCKKGGGLDLKL